MSSHPNVPETDRDVEHETRTRSLPKDDAYHLLQNNRRRAALRYLLASDNEMFVMRDVAEAVASWEHNTTVEKLTYKERQRVYISLYQSHLPKLAEHGVIEYDKERGRINLRALAHVLAPLLGDSLDTSQTLTAPDTESTAVETSEGLLSRLGLASN